jgi:hypothetical protein
MPTKYGTRFVRNTIEQIALASLGNFFSHGYERAGLFDILEIERTTTLWWYLGVGVSELTNPAPVAGVPFKPQDRDCSRTVGLSG